MDGITPLTFEQARLVGSLIEKQMTTPDSYPMTVNALVAACNQRNNREPVTAFDESDVERLLAEANDLGLTRFTRVSGGRSLKYLHRVLDVWEVDEEQAAILAIMLLRGPQTVSELKTRTDRYVEFRDLGAVDARIRDLMTRDVPLVRELPRETGQRETRYMTHLVPDHPAAAVTSPAVHRVADTPPAVSRPDLEARVTELERTVAHLVSELGLEPPNTDPEPRD